MRVVYMVSLAFIVVVTMLSCMCVTAVRCGDGICHTDAGESWENCSHDCCNSDDCDCQENNCNHDTHIYNDEHAAGHGGKLHQKGSTNTYKYPHPHLDGL